ncbi:uncharacterized protein LOC144120643 isoform X2 [Amblyomma americanum]
MEGTITDDPLECTPPMAALSPKSFAVVERELPPSFDNTWPWYNCAPFEGGGGIAVDQYIVGTVDEDSLNMLESNGHQMVVHNQMEQYIADGEQPMEQPQQQQHAPTVCAAPPPVPSSAALPATSSYEGLYGFDVACSPQSKSTKSVSYTYDESRRKLFANLDTVCPFHVFVNHTPPPGTMIRVMAVYSQPNDVHDVVKRCLVHMAEPEKVKKAGVKEAPPEHLVRCDHPHVDYHQNKTGRHSFTVPFDKPEASLKYTEYHLRFMCLSSCNTGINRRAVKLIWTLEHNGEVLGRQSIDLKVCACPGRDRRNEEKANAKQMNNSLLGLISDGHPPANGSSGHPGHVSTVTTHGQPRPQKRGWVATTTVVAGGPAKTMKVEPQQPEGEYMLKVPTKKMYTLLKLLRDSLMFYKGANPQAFRSSQSNGENCSPPMPPLHSFVDMLDAAARPGGTSSPTSAAAQLAVMKVEDSTDITSGPGALQCWLESIGLQCCFPLLVEKGIRDLNSLKQIPFKTLKRLRLKEHQETTLITAMRSLNYDDEDEELFPSQELPGAQSQGTLSQGSTANLSQQSCTSTCSTKHFHVTRIRVVHPIPDHDYS